MGREVTQVRVAPPAKKARLAKQWLRRWHRWAKGTVGAGLSHLFGSREQQAFGILMYHRVAPIAGIEPKPTWNVTPTRFRAQLAGLLDRGYEAWPLRHVLEYHQAGQLLPRKAFVVTFDDGYENNFTHAWPILCELGIPATIFVATAYLDSPLPFPFDDWQLAGSSAVAPELWRPLSSAQCHQMLQSGCVDLGSHTHTHQVFRNQPEALYFDLLASAHMLKGRFGLSALTFGFPFGISGPQLSDAARQAGMLCSLTTRGELVKPGSNPFNWGRFAVEEDDTAATIAAQLDGWCSLARKSLQRVDRQMAGILRGVV